MKDQEVITGVWIWAGRFFSTSEWWLDLVDFSGWASDWALLGCLAPPCLFWVCLFNPPPFLLFSLGTKYMDSALFQSLQLHSIHPSPVPCAALSPALGTKTHYRGESGLAQPTGSMQRPNREGLLHTAPLFLLRARVISHCPCHKPANTRSSQHAYRVFLCEAV